MVQCSFFYIFVELVLHVVACWPGQRQNRLDNWSQELPGVTGKFGIGVQKANSIVPRELTIHSRYSLLANQEKTLMLGGMGAEGEVDDRGWDSWMASLTWWTWVWVNSGSWWWTGRPGVLWFMGSQRVGHDWVTELNWIHYFVSYRKKGYIC